MKKPSKIGDYGTVEVHLVQPPQRPKRKVWGDVSTTWRRKSAKVSYGKEIDIYSLGIILFELLTGSVPFEGESSQEIIMKHLTADPELGQHFGNRTAA